AELAGERGRRLRQGLVRAENERQRTLEDEGHLVPDEARRAVGRQAQRLVAEMVADRVGAARRLGALAAVVMGRPDADPDHGRADEGFDRAHEHRRAEQPAVHLETRGEVDDAHLRAVLGFEDSLENGGVGPVAPLAALEALEIDFEDAFVALRGSAEQAVEDGIAVEPGKAGPHDPSSPVDQRSDGAVADDAEIEIAHALPPCLPPAAASARKARTAGGSSRYKSAPTSSGSRPTATAKPLRARAAAKASSSVRSSPKKTGLRPTKGCSSMKASSALPLCGPTVRSSTTHLPGSAASVPPLSRASPSASARTVSADSGAAR